MKLPITVLIAARNEEANIGRCLAALAPAERIIVLDSQSIDRTEAIAVAGGAEVIQFHYRGDYPKKRQWALHAVPIKTEWVLLLDADEVVPETLWQEIQSALHNNATDAFFITKGFHFLGRAFRFGGFSHSAVLLFRRGKARFERLVEMADDSQDMEVHERLLVDGVIASLRIPLVHRDFKGLHAYIDRHNKYSTWEAHLRHQYLQNGAYGLDSVRAKLFGNVQERRRFLKRMALRLPCEPLLWFFYHFVLCLGFLHGRRGLIASQLRASYISHVRAKIVELRLEPSRRQATTPLLVEPSAVSPDSVRALGPCL